MNWIRKHGHWLLVTYVAFVFLQSLFFKFTGSAETVYIFEAKLDPWAASLGFPGLFAPGGVFSAKVVGVFELIASGLLMLGAVTGRRVVRTAGALLGLGVISGAIFFHLFTPLGVDPYEDGAMLFKEACFTFTMGLLVAWLRRDQLLALLPRRAAMAA